MATWNSIRIPNFMAENRNNGQHEFPIESVRGQSYRLKAFAGVKRNPFPASLLKSRAQELPTSGGAASRSCAVQLHDLTKRICNKVSSYPTPFQTYGALQRSRSERKEDWDMAMSWLMDGRDMPPKDEIRETCRAMQYPVLETILLEEDGRPKICFTDVPVMLLIPPAQKSSVLGVESNMCFDMEFLLNVCNDLEYAQVRRRADERLNSIGILWIPEPSPSKILVDVSSRQERIKAPIMKSSVFHNPGLLKRSVHESLQSTFLSVHDKFDSRKKGPRTQHSLKEISDMLQLNSLESFYVAFREKLRLANKALRTISKGKFHSDVACEDKLLHACLLDKISMKPGNRSLNDIQSPILESNFLVAAHHRNLSKSILKKLAPMRGARNICNIDPFQSLAEFCRNSLMSERSLWSKASKDVMSRARYKRRRLLLPQIRVFPLILSSGQCPLKVKASSQVEMKLEELDSLVFSRLRVIFMRIDRNKSRNSRLLDSVDFVAKNVAERRREFLTTCYRAVLKTIHKFDPPTKKWSKVHFEKIRSRYESSKKCSALPGETNHQKSSTPEVIDVDSDESALEDFFLSDEDAEEQNMDGNGFGMLEEIRADLRRGDQRKAKPNGPHGNTRQGPTVDMCDFRIERHKKANVRLKVPHDLVCAPWVIEAADQCMQTMRRGSLFVPPPLSALPVAAVLTNTYLKHDVRDQRVVIICESDTNVTDYIREYLQRSLGESVSIDSIKKAEHDSVEGIAPLPHTTARVVILDSFAFSFFIPFSLLVVFITTSRYVLPAHSQLRDQVLESNVSGWSRIPSVILAPLEAGLQPCSKRICRISEELRVKDVLWVKAIDVVCDSATIAMPSTVYLAPSEQATRILVLLDAHAKPYIETYIKLENDETAETVNENLELRIVNLRLVKEAMRETPHGDTAGRHQRLELLYILRQARSFAIFDGFDTAVAYLQHCRRQANKLLFRIVNRVLGGLDEEIVKGKAQATHPILGPLRKVLKDMKHSMLQDPPSLRSIHRRDSFRPLVVANSQETVDACLQGLQDAVLLPDTNERGIAVCPVEWFQITSSKLRKNNLCETLQAFSHVFHIIDDRYDVPSNLLLPPSLLQQVHAGRTRLVTIIVDETRELDSRWKLETSWYHGLTKKLAREEIGDIECKAPYLQQVSMESFWSAARSVLPNCVDEVPEQVQPSILQGDPVNAVRRVDSPACNPKALHLAPNEICAFTVQGLRAMLIGRLEAISREFSGLEINLHVHPDESCSPAATYLHSAVAGNERLRKNVLIRTTFSF